MQIQTNDYQMRLGLLIREKTAYLLTGLAIVILAFVSVFYLRTTHSLTLPMTRPDTTQQVVVTQQPEQKAMPVVEHYTVKEGESLWMIAENTYGDGLKAYDIAKANTIADSNIISVGQDLILPDVDTQKMMTAVPVQENGQITEVAAQTQRVTVPTSYTVQTGDYLFAISEKIYGDGNMWPLIAQANNITNPDTIYKDTVLTLPQKK